MSVEESIGEEGEINVGEEGYVHQRITAASYSKMS